MSGSKSFVRGAAPEPVSLTVHSVAAPQAEVIERRTRVGRFKMLLVLLICAAPVIASYVAYFVWQPQARSNYSDLIVPTKSLPALTLRTLQGEPVAAVGLRGQWLLIAIGDAACGPQCEQRLYMQRQLREMLGRERDRLDKVWLLTGAGEPRSALREAVASTPGMTILRADAAELAAWLSPEAGRSLQEHLYLVDPMGEWMMRLPVQPEPSRVKRDLERLLRASASWDRPGR
jgi:hypothetical protein